MFDKNSSSTIVSVTFIIFLGKIWMDIMELYKYKIRIKMCMDMMKEATELIERYTDIEKKN